jgi:predicted CXXCH cytochrome family protein
MVRLGAPPSHAAGAEAAREALAVTRGRFGEPHLVELGIGCESCHLGAAEHVRDPSARPSMVPRSSFFEVRGPRDPRGRPADRVNRACARCHQVLFSGYEHTWEGGARRAGPGGSNINSGEARDMLLGACASELSCVGCHEPHARDATASLRALDAVKKDALCTRCHAKYEAPAALRAHAHHDPAGAGARCISCHMATKTMSLDGELTAYHRIGSPTDPERVLLDRPVECALCHADVSVSSLVETMERWWNKRYDRPALVKLYGDLGANALLATAARGKPHEQGVAYHALGRARVQAAVPELVAGLRHPYPLVRGYAKRALDAVVGAPVPIDIDAEDAALEAQIRAWEASRPAPSIPRRR